MIKTCFNYVGNKNKLIPLIKENLDYKKSNFIDLFGGSGIVALNVVDDYKKLLINDKCWQVIDTLKYFRSNKVGTTLADIGEAIDYYELSKDNKEGYLRLREVYNNFCYNRENFEPVIFYCLVTHAFNYMIHFNSKEQFSVPSGASRSYFSPVLRDKLISNCEVLHSNKNKIFLQDKDFTKLLSKSNYLDYMIFVDPPYLNSDDSYSRVQGMKWTESEERLLYKKLDEVSIKGGSFMLTNTVSNNGKENKILREWMGKYKVTVTKQKFDNCNYQRKNEGETVEVLVVNY